LDQAARPLRQRLHRALVTVDGLGRPRPHSQHTAGRPAPIRRRATVRVLHIITGLDVGGAELQVRMLLQHTRHDGEVLALYNPATVAGMIRADGGRVRDLGMRRNTQLSAVPRLARLLRSERFDVVHVHLYRACVYGRAAAWLARTPVVVTSEHSIGETHIERRRMTW